MSEPWLSGRHKDLHPTIAAVLYCFEQALDDLYRWTDGADAGVLWYTAGDLAPAAVQIRHLGGSVDRLITYARGGQLSEEQLSEMESERKIGHATREELLNELRGRLARAEEFVRSIDPDRLAEPREVGRKRLPTTLGGLLVHIAEHTQRHVGEAIITLKVASGRAR